MASCENTGEPWPSRSVGKAGASLLLLALTLSGVRPGKRIQSLINLQYILLQKLFTVQQKLSVDNYLCTTESLVNKRMRLSLSVVRKHALNRE